MAWSKLEDTFQDDSKFRQLSEVLGFKKEIGAERGMALAQGHVARLWSWASRHAPDGVLPQRGCTEGDVERVCGWSAARGRLYRGLVEVGLIDEYTDERGIVREIHRFWERAESHKAAQRKRKERNDREHVTRQSRPGGDVVTGPSRLEEREDREEREEREDRRSHALAIQPEAVPNSNDLGQIQRSQIPLVEAARFYEAYRKIAERLNRPCPPPLIGPMDRENCRGVLWLSGWNSAEPSDSASNAIAWGVAVRTAEAYLASTEQYLQARKWPIRLLAEPKNFEHARGAAAPKRDQGNVPSERN